MFAHMIAQSLDFGIDAFIFLFKENPRLSASAQDQIIFLIKIRTHENLQNIGN